MRSLLFIWICFGSISTIVGEDWPSWRGIRGDGTWKAPKLPEKWPEKGLKQVWKQPIGGGYSGICVADGKVFTMDLEKPIVGKNNPKEKNQNPQPDGTERVLCLDAKTGKPLWSHKYEVRYGGLGGYNNGPRAMPTFHEGKLYTLGAVGHLFCFDANSGKILWSKDMVKDFKAQIPEWGFAASPVIDEDRVLIHSGAEPKGCLIAFDHNTGKEIWRCISDPTGYCTPMINHAKSGKQVVLWTPEHIHGIEAKSGKPLWKVPYKVTYGVSIATPIFHEEMVFVTGYWEGAKAIRLGQKPTDHEVAWTDTRNLRGLMAQPLYRDGFLYCLDKQNGLTCVEYKSGKKIWTDDNKMTPKGRNPHASFVWINDEDRILSLNSEGELILAKLNPDGYHEQSRTNILSKRTWSHPGFSDSFIYVRSDGGEQMGKQPFELICFQLTP
jgi:outer membrane protein assembly factor BamB